MFVGWVAEFIIDLEGANQFYSRLLCPKFKGEEGQQRPRPKRSQTKQLGRG